MSLFIAGIVCGGLMDSVCYSTVCVFVYCWHCVWRADGFCVLQYSVCICLLLVLCVDG